MRLIDADSLYDALGDKLTWLIGYGDDVYLTVGSDIRDTIDNQPTAYDIDKVVEELKQRSKEYNSGVRLHGKPEEMLTNDAIEVVKQGSVSDDCCEWKTKDNQNMFAMWETGCGNQTMLQKLSSYKYCPYCGKEIKVVE